MPKSTRNSGKRWSETDISNLKELIQGNTPTGVISLKLGRTEGAIYAKASEQNLSVKPTNQKPYNRRKK